MWLIEEDEDASSSASITIGRGVFRVVEALPVDNLRVFCALYTGESVVVELFELLDLCVTCAVAAVAAEAAGRSSTFWSPSSVSPWS